LGVTVAEDALPVLFCTGDVRVAPRRPEVIHQAKSID
jgi:hypothetical protein